MTILKQELLITGGAGFIGSNFIRYLLSKSSYKITNIDSLTYAGNVDTIKLFDQEPNYRFIQCDISDFNQLEQVFDRPYDVIINFAAESHVDRSIENALPFVGTNILGTIHLLQAVLAGKAKKMIQISTDEVYGSLSDQENPFTEQTPLAPNNPYSASKASADLFARSFINTYNLPIIITRCSNNFGPYQHSEKLIPKVILSALNNQKISLYGDGMNRRDWLYVKDHCRAIERVMESGEAGEVYNIGGGFECTNKEVILLILNYLGKSEALIEYVDDRKGHDRRYAINSAKIEQQLNWKASHSFHESLIETIEWFKQNSEWIDHV